MQQPAAPLQTQEVFAILLSPIHVELGSHPDSRWTEDTVALWIPSRCQQGVLWSVPSDVSPSLQSHSQAILCAWEWEHESKSEENFPCCL